MLAIATLKLYPINLQSDRQYGRMKSHYLAGLAPLLISNLLTWSVSRLKRLTRPISPLVRYTLFPLKPSIIYIVMRNFTRSIVCDKCPENLRYKADATLSLPSQKMPHISENINVRTFQLDSTRSHFTFRLALCRYPGSALK